MSALPSPHPVPHILLGITATTGIVDAVSLLALGHVFTANMTGNVWFLGFALTCAQSFSIPRSSMALIAFLQRWRRRVASVLLMFAGAAVGGVVLKRSVAAAQCRCGIASVACALAAFERFPHPRGGDSRRVHPASESSNI
jgi:uncharacterized membrane protein YoaK (UPF0700 family)